MTAFIKCLSDPNPDQNNVVVCVLFFKSTESQSSRLFFKSTESQSSSNKTNLFLYVMKVKTKIYWLLYPVKLCGAKGNGLIGLMWFFTPNVLGAFPLYKRRRMIANNYRRQGIAGKGSNFCPENNERTFSHDD